MKLFKEIVLILGFVFICLFFHDLFNVFHLKSEELFFPKLYENSCFYSAFDRDIKNEKIISFECFEDMWHATGRYAKIIMFCYEGCGPKGDIFKYWMEIKQKPIAEIEKQSQQYDGFYYFKSILKKEYYHKHQEPLTKAILSHFSYSSNRQEPRSYADMLWYDHYSKILWYEKERG